MGFFGGVGKALKGAGKVLGKGMQVAAPFAGMIPSVGVPLAAGLGVGGKLLGKALAGENTFKNIGATLATGAAAGAGSALTGNQGYKGLGNIFPKLGALSKQVGTQSGILNPGGGLNFGKAIGAGGAIANVAGGMAQRKTNQKALQSQTDLRNQLMSRILSGNQQTYSPSFN